MMKRAFSMVLVLSLGYLAATTLYANSIVAVNSGWSDAENSLAQEEPGNESSARILNPGAPVVMNTSAKGVSISDFKLKINERQVSGATFTIHNDSSKPLVAFVVGVDFYWNSSPNHPLHWSLSEDSWFLNSILLQPGEQEPGRFTNTMIPHQTARLLRVEVYIDFAQFSDGSVAGRHADMMKAQFDKGRRSELEVQRHYANMLKAGATPAEVAQQVEADLRDNKYKGIQYDALTQIWGVFKNRGPKGLAEELIRKPVTPL